MREGVGMGLVKKKTVTAVTVAGSRQPDHEGRNAKVAAKKKCPSTAKL